MKISSTALRTAANVILLATIASAILLVLPMTDNFLFQSKYYSFIFLTLLLGIVYVLHSIRRGAVEIVLSPFAGTLAVFGGAVLASTFFTSNYPVESLLGFGGVYLAMILFVLFSGSAVDTAGAKKIVPALAISASVLTLMAVIQMIGYGPANVINQITGLSLPTNISFSLSSSPFIALQIIAIALVAIVTDVISKKNISKFAAITLPILVIGLGIHIWAVLPGKPAALVLPSWEASWSVALDTIRTPRAALIGMGPDSYVNMYTRFKPVWVNGTPNWALSFTQGSNVPLTLLATTGFIGLISWLVVVYVSYKTMRTGSTPEGRAFATTLFASFIMQFFIPANIVILALQAVLIVGVILSERNKYGVLKFQALAMSIEKKIAEAIPAISRQTAMPVYLTAGALMIAILVLTYMTGQTYAASMAAFSASKALAENDAVKVYEQQQKAVALNPYLDTYRRQYAATNLLIATSLANKADATDADKEQVAQLLQQAVREAQSATLLDQYDVQNWAILAQIYQNMIGAVEEADQFSVQAYVQAIQNDPTNPSLRVSVGGIFLGQKQYQNALSLFNQAIEIKPDFQNAYYNAAFTLKALEAYPQAKQAYEKLLQLMDPASEDYATVTKELEEVNKIVEEQAEATKSGQLSNDASNSLLQQNLQDSNDTINAPVNDDVDLSGSETTPLGGEVASTPAPTPSPSATPAP
jgi:tetratricopeptide (TPR) repeat protein